MLMLVFLSLLCPVRTCWHKHKHKHKRKSISQSASTHAYVNDVLTEHKDKHKHKKKLMLMSRLSSLAHKLLMLMFMLMFASLVRTGLNGLFLPLKTATNLEVITALQCRGF